jgi:hypothetical protein
MVDNTLKAMRTDAGEVTTAKAEMELGKLRKQREKLLKLSVQGMFTDAEIAKEMANIDDQTRTWAAVAEGVKAAIRDLSPSQVAMEIASLLAEFQFLNLTEKKKLLTAMVGDITVTGNAITKLSLRIPKGSDQGARDETGSVIDLGDAGHGAQHRTPTGAGSPLGDSPGQSVAQYRTLNCKGSSRPPA